MQDEDRSKTTGSSRRIKVLLALSLALNLMFIGFVTGAALRHDRGAGGATRTAGLGAFGAPYMLALPREDRRAVLREMRAAGEEPLPDRRARRAMFQQVLTHLRATPFDADALEAAVSGQAEVSVAVQRRAQAAWLTVVAGMDDPERALYADAIEEGLARRNKRR